MTGKHQSKRNPFVIAGALLILVSVAAFVLVLLFAKRPEENAPAGPNETEPLTTAEETPAPPAEEPEPPAPAEENNDAGGGDSGEDPDGGENSESESGGEAAEDGGE